MAEGYKQGDGLMKRRDHVERVTRDDEIVGNGHVHIERMSEHHIWANVLGRAINFYAIKGAHGCEIVWDMEDFEDDD